MSRTIGHTRRQSNPGKARVKEASRKNWRTSNRALIHKVLSGVTDCEEAIWLYRPRQLVRYWDFY